MLTVSSTAALEAVGAGVRTAFLRIWMCANSWATISLASGLLRTFDQLEIDDVGVPNKSWIEDYFFDSHDVAPAQQIADRALELTERADRSRPRAWRTAIFASQHELFTYRKQAARAR